MLADHSLTLSQKQNDKINIIAQKLKILLALKQKQKKEQPCSVFEEADCSIYLGNYANASNLEFLTSKKIGLIISCLCPPTEKVGNIKYETIPVSDKKDQPITPYFKKINSLIKQHICQGYSIYIHCFQGKSRSPAFLMAYLIGTHKHSFEQAYKIVKLKHTITQPRASFLEELRSYAKKVQKNNQSISQSCNTNLLGIAQKDQRLKQNSSNESQNILQMDRKSPILQEKDGLVDSELNSIDFKGKKHFEKQTVRQGQIEQDIFQRVQQKDVIDQKIHQKKTAQYALETEGLEQTHQQVTLKVDAQATKEIQKQVQAFLQEEKQENETLQSAKQINDYQQKSQINSLSENVAELMQKKTSQYLQEKIRSEQSNQVVGHQQEQTTKAQQSIQTQTPQRKIQYNRQKEIVEFQQSATQLQKNDKSQVNMLNYNQVDAVADHQQETTEGYQAKAVGDQQLKMMNKKQQETLKENQQEKTAKHQQKQKAQQQQQIFEQQINAENNQLNIESQKLSKNVAADYIQQQAVSNRTEIEAQHNQQGKKIENIDKKVGDNGQQAIFNIQSQTIDNNQQGYTAYYKQAQVYAQSKEQATAINQEKVVVSQQQNFIESQENRLANHEQEQVNKSQQEKKLNQQQECKAKSIQTNKGGQQEEVDNDQQYKVVGEIQEKEADQEDNAADDQQESMPHYQKQDRVDCEERQQNKAKGQINIEQTNKDQSQFKHQKKSYKSKRNKKKKK